MSPDFNSCQSDRCYLFVDLCVTSLCCYLWCHFFVTLICISLITNKVLLYVFVSHLDRGPLEEYAGFCIPNFSVRFFSY
jgi:hypothetical protein